LLKKEFSKDYAMIISPSHHDFDDYNVCTVPPKTSLAPCSYWAFSLRPFHKSSCKAYPRGIKVVTTTRFAKFRLAQHAISIVINRFKGEFDVLFITANALNSSYDTTPSAKKERRLGEVSQARVAVCNASLQESFTAIHL
jgi:hypothetical protein